jgi:hypothetical protein
VNKRPQAAPGANDREPTPTHRVNVLSPLTERGSWSVERTVAQHDAVEPIGGEHRALQIANCVQGGLELWSRVGIERVVLVLHGSPFAGIRPPGKTLRNEPAGTGRARRGDQMRRSFGAQSIGCREFLIEPAQIAEGRQGSELVDDDFRHRLLYGGHHGGPIERVGNDRLGTGIAQSAGPFLRPRHADHCMPRPQRKRDEAVAQGPAGACDENPHDNNCARRRLLPHRRLGV